MKVLHINCSDQGSTGKIIQQISKRCVDLGHKTVLCVPKIDATEDDPSIKKYKTSLPKEQGLYDKISYFLGFQFGFAPISTARILHIINKEKPDVIHIHSANCYMVNLYSLFKFIKKHCYPVVVTNHAEFFYTGNCAHAKSCTKYLDGCGKCPSLFYATRSKMRDTSHQAWVRMKKCFEQLENSVVVSVSPWVNERSCHSPIMEHRKQKTVLNGVDTDTFCVEQTPQTSSKTILFVTSMFNASDFSEKGGGYVMELAKRFLGENVNFVVIGKVIGEYEPQPNVNVIGPIFDQKKLAEHYRNASVTILLSCRETFGMSVAESLCCGTPVVGFKAGGPESIALTDHTEFIEYGDLDALESIIRNKWLQYKTSDSAFLISKDAIKKYSAERMAREYIEIYEELSR